MNVNWRVVRFQDSRARARVIYTPRPSVLFFSPAVQKTSHMSNNRPLNSHDLTVRLTISRCLSRSHDGVAISHGAQTSRNIITCTVVYWCYYHILRVCLILNRQQCKV